MKNIKNLSVSLQLITLLIAMYQKSMLSSFLWWWWWVYTPFTSRARPSLGLGCAIVSHNSFRHFANRRVSTFLPVLLPAPPGRLHCGGAACCRRRRSTMTDDIPDRSRQSVPTVMLESIVLSCAALLPHAISELCVNIMK